jgi:hypothetical protein
MVTRSWAFTQMPTSRMRCVSRAELLDHGAQRRRLERGVGALDCRRALVFVHATLLNRLAVPQLDVRVHASAARQTVRTVRMAANAKAANLSFSSPTLLNSGTRLSCAVAKALGMRAHITFVGGGLVLPARTPYERQLLREHVLSYARSKEPLQLTVDRTTWVIDRPSAKRPLVCDRCQRRLTAAALHAPNSIERYCVACALH